MCAVVYYTKWKKGRLYPKAARTGPYAYAQEVTRVNGKVVTKYIGIVRLPGNVDLIKKGGKENADHPGESEQVQP